MTTRSQLLNNVLRTWDESIEGYLYLRWLIDPDLSSALEGKGHPQLEGGDILREAVLEITLGDGIRRESVNKALDEFCTQLQQEDAESVREVATKIASWILDMPSAIRGRTEDIGKYGHSTGLGRLGFLKFIAELNRINRGISDEDFKADFPEIGGSLERWKSLLANEQTSAEIAARCRTTTEVTANAVKTEQGDGKLLWRFLMAVLLDFRRQKLAQALTLERVFDDWKTENNLDRHYSYELVARLPQIVDRASVLERVQHKEVANKSVRQFFNEAHDVFLYGFDTACIALCRSLIEHALRDKLGVSRKDRRRLEFMIQEAEDKKLLDGIGLTSAESVEEAGNHIMHNIPLLRSTAQTVLDHTRIVLNKLYGDAANDETKCD
jgi:hypothetical protein